jgi:hypothetical protein
LRLCAENDADRELVRRSRVLLDGQEQDITDIRLIDTDEGLIESLERPARVVWVMGQRMLATTVSRGKVEVAPR